MARSTRESDAISGSDARGVAVKKSWKDILETALPAESSCAQVPDGGGAPMAPDMSDGPDAGHAQHDSRNGWEGAEGGDDLAAKAHSENIDDDTAGTGVQTPHDFSQPHNMSQTSSEGQHQFRGATDEEVAELEEQARQLALNVGAAEFSPMGPGGARGTGKPSGPHVHFGPGQNPGMNRNMPHFAMRGPMSNGMPYEMMQSFAHMHNNPIFFGGAGMMPQDTGDELPHSPGSKGNGHGNVLVSSMHGDNGPAVNHNSHQMQPQQQTGAQGQGGMPPYFNGYHGGMNMMSPFGFGPNGHPMYGPLGPFMGNNMQGAPKFWGAHGGMPPPPQNMGMGGANGGGHPPQHGGNGIQHNGIGHKGMRGGGRERVTLGRTGQPMRGHVSNQDHSYLHSNSMGYKHRAHAGNCGYNMHAKHTHHMFGAKPDTRFGQHSMQPPAHHPTTHQPQDWKAMGPSANTPEAKPSNQMPAGTHAADESGNGFALNVSRIEEGEDQRTTVMVKNIPNKYTQRNLLDLIDTTYAGAYDFFYLPIDFKNKCNLGYAFINFRQPSSIGTPPFPPLIC